METKNSTSFRSFQNQWTVLKSFVILFFFFFSLNPLNAQNRLRVMKMGLGDGTIKSKNPGINCGATCEDTYNAETTVTLIADPSPGSTFVGWEGDVTSVRDTISVDVNQVRSIRAEFQLTRPIPKIADFAPEKIDSFLTANTHVNTPSRFLAALPDDYKRNWVLMSRSESLQTGTAKIPRIILPSPDTRFVFTIGMGTSSSYPGSHPNAIEYMEWNDSLRTFRMHEIVVDTIPPMGTLPGRSRKVSIDDAKCSKCHSTRNVINRSRFPGTSPRGVIPKSKPNWDTYDSWGGMLVFNRDRIYQGSLEAAAFRKLFNMWNWQGNAPTREVLEQLELQPKGVRSKDSIGRFSGGVNDGHVWFAFDGRNNVVTSEPAPSGTSTINTNYKFDGVVGSGDTSVVQRDSTFLTLQHTLDKIDDEGRGVRLFDALGGAVGDLNQLRVADEIIKHKYATGSVPIDVRPIALAIISNKVYINVDSNKVLSANPNYRLRVDTAFFNNRIMKINDLFTDTKLRQESLTRRKVDIQKFNFDRRNDPYTVANIKGLIKEYGDSTSFGDNDTITRVRQEVFRRGLEGFDGDRTVMNGIYVDREDYFRSKRNDTMQSYNVRMISMFRYFLEPLGVTVDEWSINVRSRSLGYNFADVFHRYGTILERELKRSLREKPVIKKGTNIAFDVTNDSLLIVAVNQTLSNLPSVDDIPTYTDVQRIFNKACIECHGGLRYPPYENLGGFRLDLSENEYADGVNGNDRLKRSYDRVLEVTTTDTATSRLYQRLIDPNQFTIAGGMMPMNGPPLSNTDIETIKRWILGTPSRPYTHGDPHIGTVNGVRYDFQAAGEFTLLKAQNIEIQARQTAVETSRPLGPNPHTGLTSCVSINTAFAIRLGGNRITYQPSAMGQEGSEMQLRVDGKLVNLTKDGVKLELNGRIIPVGSSGIQIEGRGGTIIVITAGWWSRIKQWYLHMDIRHIRAKRGIMGEITKGNWLPALPDGTQLGRMPKSLADRHDVLYNRFGNAWSVTDANSLFDYTGGTSSDTYVISSWPPQSGTVCEVPNTIVSSEPLPPMDRLVAENLCGAIREDGRRENCIQDLIITGEVNFAEIYLEADRIDQNTYPEPPKLLYPKDFEVTLSFPVEFEWERAKDADGDDLKYTYYVWEVNDDIDQNLAEEIFEDNLFSSNSCLIYIVIFILFILILWYFISKSNSTKKDLWKTILGVSLVIGIVIIWISCSGTTMTKTVSNLEAGKSYFWKVTAEDGNGGIVESETYRFDVK
jgi:hypothetical protein